MHVNPNVFWTLEISIFAIWTNLGCFGPRFDKGRYPLTLQEEKFSHKKWSKLVKVIKISKINKRTVCNLHSWVRNIFGWEYCLSKPLELFHKTSNDVTIKNTSLFLFHLESLITIECYARCIIWDKVFKNGLSKVCGRQPLKNFRWFGKQGRFYTWANSLLKVCLMCWFTRWTTACINFTDLCWRLILLNNLMSVLEGK